MCSSKISRSAGWQKSALYDSIVGVMANQASNQLIGGVTPNRLGNAHPNIVPYQVFACEDGHIIAAVGNDGQFERFCSLLGCSELSADPAYATNPARVENRDVLVPLLVEAVSRWRKADLLTAMENAVVPGAPINTLADVFVDPQIQSRGMRIEPQGVPGVRSPLQFSEAKLDLGRRSPNLGEHTDEILSEIRT